MESFRQKLEQLPRERLLALVKEQDVELFKQVRRIEWVFEHKLAHLTWTDGMPITQRLFTNQELSLLIDKPFQVDPELLDHGMSVDDQKQLHIAQDPVLWARHFLDVKPYAYQTLILRWPGNRKVLRAGRRLGKTFCMALALLHYSWTHNDGRCIVVAPMKSHVEIIYREVLRLAKNNPIVFDSIVRNVTSPQYEISFSNGSYVKFFTSGIKCLTPDHDVLTRDGWKSIAEVKVDEEVVSWKEGKLLWSKAEAVWSYDYSGELATHSGKQLSFRTTLEHKFLAKPKLASKFRPMKVTDLKRYYRIPATGEALPSMSNLFSGDELELWGWWISEGGGFDGNSARFSQKKQPGLNRILELAHNLGFSPKTYTYGEKATEIRILGWKPPIFSGKNCYDKFIPRELMGEKFRDRLLQGLLAGDGWMRRKGWEYSSSSKQLVNDVQELAISLGLRANLREKKIRYEPVGGGQPNRHWIVSAYPREEVLIEPNKMSREQYTGKVYCLTIPETGVFLTRHNGLIHITSNSGGKADVVRGQEAHLIVLDELDYMHLDDLESLYAMLQQTAPGQAKKQLIGASTPTGQRSTFWKWCQPGSRFKEFWFPSYCNMYLTREDEDEFRHQYSEMGYRHEIEADWGEDIDGVYPRRYVDKAFANTGWVYHPGPQSARSFFVMGVDWDKYAAGTNIVILEVCNDDYEDPRFRGKTRLAYREETIKEEYSLTNAVDRIIQLNAIFNIRHIYVDRGFGEVQVELLHKYGVEHPNTGLKKKVVGVSSSETLEVRDPASKQIVKKDIKPFMVDNLRQMLEAEQLVLPSNDEESFSSSKSLYLQLISYVVARTTQTGRPVFEAGGDAEDHAHDALLLACFAITKNYGDLMKLRLARFAQSVSNEAFLPIFELSPNEGERQQEKVLAQNKYGTLSNAPVATKRAMTARLNRSNISRQLRRRTF